MNKKQKIENLKKHRDFLRNEYEDIVGTNEMTPEGSTLTRQENKLYNKISRLNERINELEEE